MSLTHSGNRCFCSRQDELRLICSVEIWNIISLANIVIPVKVQGLKFLPHKTEIVTADVLRYIYNVLIFQNFDILK